MQFTKRLILSSVSVANHCLWLSHQRSFIPFLLPQGAVWQQQSSNKFRWLFRHATEAKSFYRRLLTYSGSFHRFFFFKLRMRGLGYRIRRLAPLLYRFYFTKTNYIHLHLPLSVFLYLRKRRLFLVSRRRDLLHKLVKHILNLHPPLPYNKRGFSYPRYLRRRKPGKKVL